MSITNINQLGKVFRMSAPSINHQRVYRKLSTKIDDYLEGKLSEIF